MLFEVYSTIINGKKIKILLDNQIDYSGQIIESPKL